MSATVRKSLMLFPALLGATVFASAASAQSPETTAANLKETLATQARTTDASTLKEVATAPSAPAVANIAAPTLIAATPVEQAKPAAAAAPSPTTIAQAAPATPSLSQVASYSSEGRGVNDLDQVTSVSQLTDVRPTDWAFQALQSLVERYGCIVGYPDRTYRGNQALTRFEFAAGLNACLDRVSELIAAATADLVRKEDLEILRKLQEEFAAELATLRGRVDALEARTATLEKQQFSTTTKLNGEVIFSVADTFGDAATENGAGGEIAGEEDDRTQTVFQNRVRLSLDSSFSGRDRLRTRLQARNAEEFRGDFTGTNMTRLSYDGNDDNAVEVDKLYYRFPVGDNIRVQIDAINMEFYDGLISSLSALESSGLGSISRFGRFNPILRVNNPNTSGSAGITAAFGAGGPFRFEAGFSADRDSNDPSETNGLFDGGITGIAQVVFDSGNFTGGLTYAYNYSPEEDVNITGSTGSVFASSPFGARPTRTHSLGAAAQFRFSPQFIIGGWGGLQFANDVGNNDSATVLNAALYLAAPDLGKRGNLGAILVGLPPKVTTNDLEDREDDDTSIHVEGFYRYRINDNIAITPGVIVIFNPEHSSENATQFVGVLRTTFTF